MKGNASSCVKSGKHKRCFIFRRLLFRHKNPKLSLEFRTAAQSSSGCAARSPRPWTYPAVRQSDMARRSEVSSRCWHAKERHNRKSDSLPHEKYITASYKSWIIIACEFRNLFKCRPYQNGKSTGGTKNINDGSAREHCFILEQWDMWCFHGLEPLVLGLLWNYDHPSFHSEIKTSTHS